ncbi:hypothetical protein GmHk_04G010550 [Glycine max]|nr:hypothetical protein GmHk_04G010550 [Glycine max]
MNTSLSNASDVNVIEVPLSYHRKWSHGIYESVIMCFVAWDKNTNFNVDVVGPLHRQTHQRSATTTKRHVFTIDVSGDMIQNNYQLVLPPEASNYLSGSKKYMIVDRGRGRLYEWMITINNGLYHSWIQYLADSHLKPGDEVAFFYNFDQHLWEVLYRKQVKWNQEEDKVDST